MGNLAGYVERKVVCVDDASNELQVVREQVLAVVLDKYVVGLEMEFLVILISEQCRRRPFWNKEQRPKIHDAFEAEMQVPHRVHEVVRDELVKFVQLLIGDVAFVFTPQRFHGVGLLITNFDREVYKVGVLLDDIADPILFGKFRFIFF